MQQLKLWNYIYLIIYIVRPSVPPVPSSVSCRRCPSHHPSRRRHPSSVRPSRRRRRPLSSSVVRRRRPLSSSVVVRLNITCKMSLKHPLQDLLYMYIYGGRPFVRVKESNSRRPSRDYQPKKEAQPPQLREMQQMVFVK